MQGSRGIALFGDLWLCSLLLVTTTNSWFLGIDTPQLPKNQTAPFMGPMLLCFTRPFPAQPAGSEGEVSLFLSGSCLFLSLFKSGRWGRRWGERIHERDTFP